MKIFAKIAIAHILLIIAVCLALVFGGVYAFQKPGPLAKTTFVVIDRGASAGDIAETLGSQGVVSSPAIFKFVVKVVSRLGPPIVLKAGEYEFMPHMSMQEVMGKLESGQIYLRKFTVPEGLTSWQVVQLLNKVAALKGHIDTIPPEGSLLPETYHYTRGDSRAEVIGQMQKTMQDTLALLWDKRDTDLPLSSPEEALILASIVEKETGKPEERRAVAGVFINRLKKGIPLQTDPSVIYAITKGKIEDNGQGPLGRRLLKKDLEIDSPYNTYKYAGLPPTPIAAPGRASIMAVLHPEPHDFLYFVADGTGGHVFAKTLEEHNRNVAQWRRIRRNQNSIGKQKKP